MAFLNWLVRALRQDRAERYPGKGILAFFWDGGAPAPHGIKDLSSSGAYIYATERWYVGTVLDMSFRETVRPAKGTPQETLLFTIPCRVVRHGPDGMGVAFQVRNPQQQDAVRTLLSRMDRERAMRALGKVIYSAS